MADKLGFTFYPQDWWSSDSFFDFSPVERYIYLECIFIMYRNDGYMKTQKTQFENRVRISVDDDVWTKITSKFILTDSGFTSLTVNKRLKKAEISKENGKLGGRPPKETQKTQPNNLKRKRKGIESEKKVSGDKSPSRTLQERKDDFYKLLIPEVKNYNTKMIREFFDYWTEHSPKGKKLRFEKQPVFDVKRRLSTWATREGFEPPPQAKPPDYTYAEHDKADMLPVAWEKTYEYKLQNDEQFRKHFGYELRNGKAVAIHNRSTGSNAGASEPKTSLSVA